MAGSISDTGPQLLSGFPFSRATGSGGVSRTMVWERPRLIGNRRRQSIDTEKCPHPA